MRLFDDDFLLIDGTHYHAPVWPPPSFIRLNGEVFYRASFSNITDAQRQEMTNVCRGAEYIPVDRHPFFSHIREGELVPMNVVTLQDVLDGKAQL